MSDPEENLTEYLEQMAAMYTAISKLNNIGDSFHLYGNCDEFMDAMAILRKCAKLLERYDAEEILAGDYREATENSDSESLDVIIDDEE
jgi:hypothetical protein